MIRHPRPGTKGNEWRHCHTKQQRHARPKRETRFQILNQSEIFSAQKQAELAELKLNSAKQAMKDRKTTSNPGGANPMAIQSPTPIDAPDETTPLYPQVYMDELRLTFESARSDIGRFEKEYGVNLKGREQAQAELNVLQLKAPREGLVTRAFKQAGEGIQSGEKVLEIISTKRIRVEVDVPAVTAARLRVGMPIIVIVQQPTGENEMSLERYPTALKFIDPTIGQVSQKVRIWAEIDNSEGRLREGLAASMEIVTGSTRAE